MVLGFELTTCQTNRSLYTVQIVPEHFCRFLFNKEHKSGKLKPWQDHVAAMERNQTFDEFRINLHLRSGETVSVDQTLDLNSAEAGRGRRNPTHVERVRTRVVVSHFRVFKIWDQDYKSYFAATHDA